MERREFLKSLMTAPALSSFDWDAFPDGGRPRVREGEFDAMNLMLRFWHLLFFLIAVSILSWILVLLFCSVLTSNLILWFRHLLFLLIYSVLDTGTYFVLF